MKATTPSPGLKKGKTVFSGQVKSASGNGIQKIKVVLSEQLFRGTRWLAETLTDTKGNYSLAVISSAAKIAYVLEVVDSEGKSLASPKQFFNPGPETCSDFTISDPRFKGKTAFSLRKPLLDKYFRQLNTSPEKEKLSQEDVHFISSQTGLDPEDTFQWLHAHELEAETGIPAEAFYGLFKQGLPADPRDLSAVNGKKIRESIEKAGEENFVSDALAAKAAKMVEQWNNYIAGKALEEVPQKMDASLGEVLGVVIKNKATQKKVLTAYLDHEGTPGEFWDNLYKVTGDNASAADIQNALKLGAITGNQPVVMAALLKRKDTRGNLFHGLAPMDKNDWVALINRLSEKSKKSVVPTFIEGRNETERVEIYATRMAGIVEKSFPTHAVFGKLAKQKPRDCAFPAQADLVKFFSNNPAFDLMNTPTISVVHKDSSFDFTGISDKNMLASELQSLQRLASYKIGFNAMSGLKKAGMDSAFNIVTVPQTLFVENFNTVLGSEEAATRVYEQAGRNYMHSVMVWAQTHPNLSFGTTATPAPIADPDLRTMFGTLDSCECEHCKSVLSPAAYYTDILNFLAARTPVVFDELIRRRPDLVHIELSCRNANTPMPYVDLVNELLENFVITHNGSSVTPPASWQTTWQADELAANPENICYEAYDELKKAVFPQFLPFNLPLEEARVYLNHLGMPRHQLMTTFYAGSEEGAFDDYYINMERLGISPQEADILSGVTTGNGSAGQGLWNFYGYDKHTGYKPLTDPADSSGQITGGRWNDSLTSRVDVFMQQTQLTYKELLALLLCYSINPVTGKDNLGQEVRAIKIVSRDSDNASCRLDNLKLSGMTISHLGKIHRFIRLWRRLGWRMYDLDRAVLTFQLDWGDDTGLNKARLNKISQAEFLARRLNLPAGDILVFWNDINTVSQTDYLSGNNQQPPSQYEQLFCNKTVINPPDKAFRQPGKLKGKLDSHSETIAAALQITGEEYNCLKTELGNGKLNLANLSLLYRNVLLAKNLSLGIRDFLSLKKLIGNSADAFDSPGSTFGFLLKAETVRVSGFTISQLNYILRHDFIQGDPAVPGESEVMMYLAELENSLPPADNSTPGEQQNLLVQKFSEKLKLSAAATGMLMKTYVKSAGIKDKAVVVDFLAAPSPVSGSTRYTDYLRLDKVATLISRMNMSDTELTFILDNHKAIRCTSLADLPVTEVAGDFAQFEILVNLVRARDSMPAGSPGIVRVLTHAITKPDLGEWINEVSAATMREQKIIKELVSGDGSRIPGGGVLGKSFPRDFLNGNLILQLNKCFSTLKRSGLSLSLVGEVIGIDFTSTVSNAVKNTAKARYEEAQWLKLARPLRDLLREQQRQALVSYVLNHATFDPLNSRYERWKNSDELYEHMLIDPEMKPVSMTSRIKQAISGVQLFIDRVLMNLEHPFSDPSQAPLKLEGEQVAEWNQWRRISRVWEANRKIFLYPENWLEPELRDDKSPFFKELEIRLKQNELTGENIEDAFHGYLEKLDEVARLEVVGLYHQEEKNLADEDDIDILHVFARTFANPHKYYHRTLENGEWTAWTKLEIDIDGDHIVPVVFNRKLCLFWLFFTQETGGQNSIPLDGTSSLAPPPKWWKIQAAWSEYRKKCWTAKRLSKSFLKSRILTPDNVQGTLEMWRDKCWVTASVAGDQLCLSLADINDEGNNAFIFSNTNDDPFPGGESMSLPGGTVSGPVNNFVEADRQMLVAKKGNDPLEITVLADGTVKKTIRVLSNTGENRFRLAVLSNEPGPVYSSFVYQDVKNTFFISHSRVTVPLSTDSCFGFGDWSSLLSDIWTELRENMPVGGHNTTISGTTGPAAGGRITMLPSDQAVVTNFVEIDRFTFTTFYHPQVQGFIGELYKKGIKGLLRREVETGNEPVNLLATYGPSLLVDVAVPTNDVDFAYGSAYAQYNWELFFHVPMLMACRLKDDQRFEEARKWFHFIFDPTASQGDGRERFWQFRPFYDTAGRNIETLDDLLKNQAELEMQVGKWTHDPFSPHVIARMRIGAYMRNVVMKYLDNLICWADNLFKRDTIEAINEATNLYILAAKILGERPQQIPSRTEHDETDFAGLSGILDPFSNAMVQIETMIAPSASSSSVTANGNTSALGKMFYFCVPQNENLLKYWDTVADRLFKIRHSLSIGGVLRSLPLYEPPIDPGMLVRAAAAGMDLGSILSDMAAELPQYRFNIMLQKACEFLNEVKALGASLLQALEKRDAEAFALLHSAQEQRVLNVVMTMKESQVEDARAQLESTRKSKEIAQLKFDYYNTREFMNSYEQQQLDSVQTGMTFSIIQGALSTIGGVLAAIPNLKVGCPPSIGATWGGDNLAGIMNAISSYMGIYAAINTAQGSMAGTYGNYTRRMDDWSYQADSAVRELEQLDKQILSAEIRLAVAMKDLENQQIQVDNNREADEFMRTKFTNLQLYDWMSGQLSTLYFQSYQLAYNLARKAEKCYQFELGEYDNTSFVQFGYWDSLKKGLLSGEKLQYDLRRMESSYYDKNVREMELTRHVSMLLLNPRVILDLRLNGACTFVIPEAVYDLDFQEHYFRRIKSVSVSIPCIAGPYTAINATLRLLSHTIRTSPALNTGSYRCEDYSNDSRFRRVITPNPAITTSSAQNDSGVFELNFRDERYLPFEGCGAISEWRLELNQEEEFRMFDYNTICDVIMTIRYTAKEVSEGSAGFKTAVSGYLRELIQGALVTTGDEIELKRMFSLKHEFASEWHKFLYPPAQSTEQVLSVTLQREHFPYFTAGHPVRVKEIEVWMKADREGEYEMVFTANDSTIVSQIILMQEIAANNKMKKASFSETTPGHSLLAVNVFAPLSFKFRRKTGESASGGYNGIGTFPEEISDLFIVVHYSL